MNSTIEFLGFARFTISFVPRDDRCEKMPHFLVTQLAKDYDVLQNLINCPIVDVFRHYDLLFLIS
jgi:hypothetical protein